MLQKAHRDSNYIKLYRALLLFDTIEFQNYFIRTTEVLFFTFLSQKLYVKVLSCIHNTNVKLQRNNNNFDYHLFNNEMQRYCT